MSAKCLAQWWLVVSLVPNGGNFIFSWNFKDTYLNANFVQKCQKCQICVIYKNLQVWPFLSFIIQNCDFLSTY